MPTTCEFYLNKPAAIYYSGETITVARIDFRGEAKVFAEQAKQNADRNCLASEVYVDNSTYVRSEGYLPAGVHSYTFAIPLPLPCPSSLEGKNGYIRYLVTFVLARPLRTNTLFNKPIIVVQNVDLNLNPLNKIPVIEEQYASYGCWPCSSGAIHYRLQIPFAAYAPQQIVKYSLLIRNQSMVDIRGYIFKFKQKQKYSSKSYGSGSRYHKNTLLRQNVEKNCLRLTTCLWEGDFIVPPMPPSSMNDGIITIKYNMEITVSISGFYPNYRLNLPIIIGTIPLQESLMA